MKIIVVNSKKHGRHEIFVDDEDFERVNQHKWHVSKGKNTFYAQTRIRNGINKNGLLVKLHRFVLNEINPKILIDHIFHNGLDCQKKNMRRCTTSENNKNISPQGRENFKRANRARKQRTGIGTSKYLGVSAYIVKCWRAYATINGKSRNLGSFPYTKEGEIEAAKAYDEALKKYDGNLNFLNFKY